MTKFKGTKGKLELKFVSGICIGIGTVGDYSQITANTVINHIETDKQYRKEKLEIESNMKLYASAPEMLEILQTIENDKKQVPEWLWNEIQSVIKKATE